MRRKSRSGHSNIVFWLIAATVLLMAFISIFSDCLGKNPFAGREQLETPVQVYAGQSAYYHITQSSGEIDVTDREHRLRYAIYGSDEENNFVSAAAVAEGPDGALYVLDVTDSGAQRILQFSSHGTRTAIVYEMEPPEDAAGRPGGLGGLRAIDGSIWFAEIVGDSVTLFSFDGAEVSEQARAALPDAGNLVTDCSILDKTEFSVSLMNGDVMTWKNGDWSTPYRARAHDTDEYFSLVSEIAYSADGTLYLCDVGQRQVFRLSPGSGQPETVLARSEFSVNVPDGFALTPIYTGLNVSNGMVTVLSAEYQYVPETDEELFFYQLVFVSEDGTQRFAMDSMGISLSRRLCIALVYLACLLMLAIFAYAAVHIVTLLRNIQLEKSVKIQLIMVVTALTVTLGVSSMIFESSNARFVDESATNLTNIAYRIAEDLDREALAGIDTPDSYESDAYQAVDQYVQEILNSKVNLDRNFYCVIYKEQNDVVCEAYQSDRERSLMYPLAGQYSGGVEEQIAAEDDYDIRYAFSTADGTYAYSLVPVYDNSGNAVAFIEVGTDYTEFDDENHQLYIRVLMLAVMAVIILMLLLSEFLFSARAVQDIRLGRRRGGICPPSVIRPLSFLYFTIANLSTAFLPIYGLQLWNDRFPMQAELAAALPLSAELICAAVSAFLCGFLIKKAGVRLICITGAALYVSGNLFAAFAGNLWVLIISNAICGTGSGFLTLALNTWAAGYEDEELQNRGFIHINAAYLAGLNCGTVIGSWIWENFGIQTAFFAAAAAAALLAVLSVLMIGKVGAAQDEEQEEGSGSLRDLFTPAVLRYFLCISVPYLTCTAFLEYFFPIEAERNGLSATHISMAFMLSGLISIYAGASLAEPITEKMGTKKTMLLASFLYAAALFYLVINPTVFSCYIVVVLFAIADSFGLSAQSVYFSALPEVKRTGQSKALGVNSTVESITSACGSLIFGAALMMGTRRGILLIAGVFALLTAVFVVSDRVSAKRPAKV